MTDSVGYVYAIKCGRYVKIGSSFSPETRLHNMRTANPNPMEIVHTARLQNEVFAFQVEMEAHKMLKEYRHHREWFKISATAARKAIEQAVEKLGSHRGPPPPEPKPFNLRSTNPRTRDPFRLGQMMAGRL